MRLRLRFVLAPIAHNQRQWTRTLRKNEKHSTLSILWSTKSRLQSFFDENFVACRTCPCPVGTRSEFMAYEFSACRTLTTAAGVRALFVAVAVSHRWLLLRVVRYSDAKRPVKDDRRSRVIPAEAMLFLLYVGAGTCFIVRESRQPKEQDDGFHSPILSARLLNLWLLFDNMRMTITSSYWRMISSTNSSALPIQWGYPSSKYWMFTLRIVSCGTFHIILYVRHDISYWWRWCIDKTQQRLRRCFLSRHYQ